MAELCGLCLLALRCSQCWFQRRLSCVPVTFCSRSAHDVPIIELFKIWSTRLLPSRIMPNRRLWPCLYRLRLRCVTPPKTFPSPRCLRSASSHVGYHVGTVLDVAGLPERSQSFPLIVVVSAQLDWADLLEHHVVELEGYTGPSLQRPDTVSWPVFPQLTCFLLHPLSICNCHGPVHVCQALCRTLRPDPFLQV